MKKKIPHTYLIYTSSFAAAEKDIALHTFFLSKLILLRNFFLSAKLFFVVVVFLTANAAATNYTDLVRNDIAFPNTFTAAAANPVPFVGFVVPSGSTVDVPTILALPTTVCGNASLRTNVFEATKLVSGADDVEFSDETKLDDTNLKVTKVRFKPTGTLDKPDDTNHPNFTSRFEIFEIIKIKVQLKILTISIKLI